MFAHPHACFRCFLALGFARHPPAALAGVAARTGRPAVCGDRPSRTIPQSARRGLAPGAAHRIVAAALRHRRAQAAAARPAQASPQAQHRPASTSARPLPTGLAGPGLSGPATALGVAQGNDQCPMGRRANPQARKLRGLALLGGAFVRHGPAAAALGRARRRNRFLHVPPGRRGTSLLSSLLAAAAAAGRGSAMPAHTQAPRPLPANPLGAAARACPLGAGRRRSVFRAPSCGCG